MRIPSGPATNILLGSIVAAWLAAWLAGFADYAILAAGFIPARLSGTIELVGALPAWLTPLSSSWVHAGFAHLAFNGLMLLFCGRFVELALGRGLLIALFAIGAYASAGAQYLADPLSPLPVVGASGAISALVGAYALLFSRQRPAPRFGIPPVVIHVVWLAIAWTGLQLLFGYAFSQEGLGIAIWSHVGGFVAGLALAVPLARLRQKRLAPRRD